MSEVIHVIVSKVGGQIARVSGSRKIPAYTTAGRAKAAMKIYGLAEDKYEVTEFIRKEAF